MEQIKFAVFGMHHGYKFALDAKKMPGVKLVAVAGDSELSFYRAKELGVDCYTNYQDLVNECLPDAVAIALPNDLHLSAVEFCAERGIHILLEKPIASTIDEGERITAICREKGVKLLVGHHRRFSSRLSKLKEVIASGELGNLAGASMFWVAQKDSDYFRVDWRVKKEAGGPLLINAVHDIDDFRFVTGQTITEVFALAGNGIRKNPVEDCAAVILRTAEGMIANYYISDGIPSPWFYEATVQENKAYHPLKGDCYNFYGTKGSITFPSMNIYYYEEDRNGWYEPLIQKKIETVENDPMEEELSHFIEVLKHKTEPLVTGGDALETLSVINAIKESAKLGKPVTVTRG